MKLVLQPGPVLLRYEWQFNESCDKGSYVAHDVTSHATQFLFEAVALDPGITLYDIFTLLGTAPLLTDVFAGYWAAELLDEFNSARCRTPAPAFDPGGIEYLELYQVWQSSNDELHPTHRLHFRGLGYPLPSDVTHDGTPLYHAGERIVWGLAGLSPRHIAHLPVRINGHVIIYSDDPRDHDFEFPRVTNHDVTLGQVLDGILFELSFHGSPAERQGRTAMMNGTLTDD